MVKEAGSTSLKKKRKVANNESEETDIYKKVCEFEEKEAANRSSAVDAKIYFETCQDIHDLLANIRDIKHNSSEALSDKTDYLTQIIIKICVIKKLNRIDKLTHVFGREILNAEKQKCDSIKLSYQNLVYELHHLVSETNKCLAFKSEDEDIELIPFKEFMKVAPESVTNKFREFDENNNAQKHALRLARLEWELTQRKNLAEECKVLEEKKKKVVAEITERSEKLSNLLPLLTNVLKAAKPLQEHLGVSLEQQRKEHKLSSFLPDPLYIFYANAVAYKNVFEANLNVVILGDKEDAIQWKEAQEVSNSNNQIEDESEPESDLPEVEEVIEVKKRRHRKSTQQVDPMEEKKKKLLEVHPLSVEVSLMVKDGPTLILTLHYYTRLKIITVTSKVDIPSKITANTACEILAGHNILSELVDEDFGLESPNPSTVYQLKKIGLGSFQSLVPQIGYAYGWAQNVCGIDFLAKKGFSEKLGQQNVEIIMKMMHKRLLTRTHLARQMQQLEQNIIPKIPDSIEAPPNPVSTLSKWSSITYQKFCQSEFTQPLVEEDLVSPSDLFYSVNITRSNANLQVLVLIKNSYPVPAPIFSLCLNYKGSYNCSNSDDIRDLERVLNVDWNYGLFSSPWLLSAQLTYLCSYLDVYLESLDSKAFPQSSKFLRNICGRNRRRPFKFKNVGTGIFTQY